MRPPMSWRRRGTIRRARSRRAGCRCGRPRATPRTCPTGRRAAAVGAAGVFDALFAGLVHENAEGRVIGGTAAERFAFDAGTVARVTGGGLPLQASGAAVLRLAWQHREHLLGPARV